MEVNAALADAEFAHEWSGLRWHEYGFDNVIIPPGIRNLRVAGVTCTEDHIADEVTSVFTALYEPAGKQEDVAALLLVGVDDPADEDDRESWEEYLTSTFPGQWEFKRTGSVLVGLPQQDG